MTLTAGDGHSALASGGDIGCNLGSVIWVVVSYGRHPTCGCVANKEANIRLSFLGAVKHFLIALGVCIPVLPLQAEELRLAVLLHERAWGILA